MNPTLLNLIGISALLVLVPMALASLLLVTAYTIGAVRVWREDRKLRRDFARVMSGERVR